MQTWSGQNAAGASSPTRKFITTVLIVFSLAGLVIGFTVGGLTHPKTTTTGSVNPITKPTVAVQVTATATATPTQPPNIVLGPPTFNPAPTSPESAASGTTYTVGLQAVDKQNKPIHSSDITCKLWLIQQIPGNQKLIISADALKNVDNLTNPIPATLSTSKQPVTEVMGALTLDATTPHQTMNCTADGQATWKYTIAPTVPPGTYDLVILTDWKGVHYNWRWFDIKIQ